MARKMSSDKSLDVTREGGLAPRLYSYQESEFSSSALLRPRYIEDKTANSLKPCLVKVRLGEAEWKAFIG